MTAAALERTVPLDDIARQAHQANAARVLLIVVTAIPWGIGYAVAKLCHFAWIGLAHLWSAYRTGWTDAHGPSKRAQILLLERQVAELAAALERVG